MRRRKGSEGQATVEMALVMPILIWLMVGMVDVARMAGSMLQVQHATREAVRLGVTGATDSQVTSRVYQVVPALDPGLMTINVSPAGTRNTGSDITVEVRYRYRVLALMAITGAQVNLGARLTARVE